MRDASAAGEPAPPPTSISPDKEAYAIATVDQHLTRRTPRFHAPDRPQPPSLNGNWKEPSAEDKRELVKRRRLFAAAWDGDPAAIAQLRNDYHLTRWVTDGRTIFDTSHRNGSNNGQRAANPRRRTRHAR